MYRFLFLFCSGMCHQLPERSFFFQGVQLPLCARCTGIYLGFLCAFLVLVFVGGIRPPRRRIDRFLIVEMVVLAVPLLFDGFSSYLGFRTTDNLIRLATGAAFGAALAPLVYYLLVDALLARGTDRAIGSDAPTRAGMVLTVPVTMLLVALIGRLSAQVLSVVLVLAVLFVFTCAAGALVAMTPRFERSVDSPRALVAPALVALAAGLVIIAISWSLQTLIHSFFGV